MQSQPLLILPTSCFHCELWSTRCDICSSNHSHCMKFHANTASNLATCAWRETATVSLVKKAIDFANDQLRTYYNQLHNTKQRNIRLSKGKNKKRHVRGLTRRLTITPDMFKTS